MFEGSSNDLTNLIQPKYQSNLEEVISIVDGFGFDPSSVNLTSNMPPSYQEYFETYLPDLLNYKQDDFTNSTSDSPTLQIKTINAIVSCVNNEMQVDKDLCQLSPKSESSDQEIKNNKENYCLVVSVFPYDSIPNRYNDEETKCAQQASNIYANLKKCVSQHDILIRDMTNSFNSNIIPQITSLKTAISNTQGDLSAVKQSLSKTIAFVESPKETNTTLVGMRGMMECQQIKKSIRRTVGNNCHKYAWHWSIMSIFMLIIAPFLVIYAILLWIATAQTSLEMAVDLPSTDITYVTK
jgi:hypothetical protein